MSRPFLSRLFVLSALGCFVLGVLPMASAAGGRRYPYRYQSSASAATRQPAGGAPTSAARSDRQTYRRYSTAPASGAAQSSTRSVPARNGRSGYGPNYWRADRKILGY